ncbi:MAG: hypothetical protein GY752_01690 [bacterium]|nr:hypothetical protein [bacterium]
MSCKEYPFSDLVEKWIDNRGKTPPLSEFGIPLLEVKHLPESGIYPLLEGTKHVSQETYDSWFRAYLEPMDILFSTVGTTARVTLTPNSPTVSIAQNVLGIRFKREMVDPLYMFYYMRGKQFQHDIEARLVTTVQASIKRADMVGIPVSLPPLEIQRNISNKIVSFDKKIELNRQTNQTLEQIAQAIFKSWFVDFEPTRAKIAAKQNYNSLSLRERAGVREKEYIERAAMAAISGAVQGCTNAAIAGSAGAAKTLEELDQLSPEQQQQLKTTAALFPDTLVDSELGEIPVGWEVKSLSSVAEIVMGQSPKGNTYNDNGNGMPLVNGPVEFGSYHTKKIKWTTMPTKLSIDGDLIVCVRGSTTGRYVKSDGEYCLGRGVCAIRSEDSQPYVDYLFKSEITNLLGLTTGSTFPSWNGPVLKNYEIVCPNRTVIKAFSISLKSIELKISKAEVEIEQLSSLRDVLLPQLLGGKFSVDVAV